MSILCCRTTFDRLDVDCVYMTLFLVTITPQAFIRNFRVEQSGVYFLKYLSLSNIAPVNECVL